MLQQDAPNLVRTFLAVGPPTCTFHNLVVFDDAHVAQNKFAESLMLDHEGFGDLTSNQSRIEFTAWVAIKSRSNKLLKERRFAFELSVFGIAVADTPGQLASFLQVGVGGVHRALEIEFFH